ncbi:MAG: hypothetical protein VCE12_07080 [Candidatus Latescibacterota bacterium]|jgi:hypothetical protein
MKSLLQLLLIGSMIACVMQFRQGAGPEREWAVDHDKPQSATEAYAVLRDAAASS